jgi:hypothetical protein
VVYILKEYGVVWAGKMNDEPNHFDGFATIKGSSFDEARNAFVKDSLAEGMKIFSCAEININWTENVYEY